MPTESEDLIAQLGLALRRAREQKAISQEELGLQTGVHRNYIGGIERGERSPSVATVLRLARALDAPLSSLFSDAEARSRRAPGG